MIFINGYVKTMLNSCLGIDKSKKAYYLCNVKREIKKIGKRLNLLRFEKSNKQNKKKHE